MNNRHPREVAELDALSGAARRNAFARVWARKEAYRKGIGTGVVGGLDSNYVGTAGAGPTGWNLTEVNSPDGFAAAVAVQGTALT
ncbi:4'-phosphopantetheinyl transferase superfamily protein [Streptomyces sp. NPDC006365]|uniref:4'-phosphopantetheinyl transferase superfamily protein n=1 Tax=Streptomyces sp. NPDC006365 TaxID=3364744 RepID=UPI00368378E0